MATEIVQAPESAESVGAAYVAAVRADHLARCAGCRKVDAEIEARAVENAASIARRDRRQLGLRITSTQAVAW